MKRATFLKNTSRGVVVRAGLGINSPLCFVNWVWGLCPPCVTGAMDRTLGRAVGAQVSVCPWSLFAV